MIKTILFIMFSCFAFAMCNSFADNRVHNIKDLDENMIDLRMYHENLGDAIVKKDQDNALWLETGLDSVLRVVGGKFDEHRKLKKPFRESYNKELKPSIKNMHDALQKKDWASAGNAYTILTKKCNGCHQDLDVDKEVQNWLLRSNH